MSTCAAGGSHPAAVRPRNMLSSCSQPKALPQEEPTNQMRSRENSARGAMSALPAVASRMVPTERPPRLPATVKFAICSAKKLLRVWGLGV